MSEWKEYRVKDICSYIGSGTTPKSSVDKYYDDGCHYWVNTGDLNNGIVNHSKQRITDVALEECSSLRFYPIGTVVEAMYGATIGKVGLLNINATVNQACCALVPKNKTVNSKFLLNYLINYKPNLLKESFGGTQPNVNQADITVIPINLPSLEEQSHIVSYLDSKTAAIDKQVSLLSEKRDAYLRLKKSIINRAVTKGLNPDVKMKDSGVEWIGEIPEFWKIAEIKAYCKEIFAGATPSTKQSEYWDGNIPWIPSGSCHDGLITSYDKTITELGYENSSTKLIKPNTTLLAMTGATCANTGYLTFSSCANQSVCAYVENEKICDSKYLFYMLQSARGYILTFQTGGAQAGINVQECSSFKVPFVPLSEQQSIAVYLDDKCTKIDSIVNNIDTQIEKYKLLKRALINEVVTGKRAV